MRNAWASPTIRKRFDSSIRALCPLIESTLKSKERFSWREYDLRKELVGCILGSRVRYEIAYAVTENLETAGMLADDWWSASSDDRFRSFILDVLSGRRDDLPHLCRYRFPNTRTTQLARARDTLAQVPISVRLGNCGADPRYLRESLVADIPGLGPKQASMFLRNIGRSYDLAILDAHVLRFMEMQGFLSINRSPIVTLTDYERVEQLLIGYADTLGYPVGFLDWAIWATVKAARELGL